MRRRTPRMKADTTRFAGSIAIASVPTPNFPGGTLLRWPSLVVGMLYYALRDKL